MAWKYGILLDDDGDLPVFCQHDNSINLKKQEIEIGLSVYLGEYTLDITKGFPYFEWLGQKPVPLNEMRVRIREYLISKEGVVRIEEFEVTFDPIEQLTSVSGNIILDTDEVIVLNNVKPYTFGTNYRPSVRAIPVVGGR